MSPSFPKDGSKPRSRARQLFGYHNRLSYRAAACELKGAFGSYDVLLHPFAFVLESGGGIRSAV